MSFRMNTQKAIEAAATLLRLVPHRMMSRKRLLALLYMADRKSIKETGRPIVGGRLTAMKYGPIHSEVYDLIKGGHADQTQWSRHFQNQDYFVCLDTDPGAGALSRYEISNLNEVAKDFMGFDDWDVAEKTHEFSEYKHCYQENTSTPIPLEEIVDAVGRGKDKDAILREAKEVAYFDQIFGTAK